MSFDLCVRNGESTQELQNHIDRRLSYALGRFDGKIGRISIRVEDLNGPKGGVDQHCRIEANLIPSGKVMAEATDVEDVLAVNRAIERLARQIRNEFERRRTRRKRGAVNAADKITI